MDDFGINKRPPGGNLNKPVPFDDSGDTKASHQPLGPSDDSTAKVPAGAKKPAEQAASSDRITGVKTFFTKLHAGAIDFLDEQITNWLKSNPSITVKRTNTVTGDVVGKKTEPNLIVTIWY